MPDKPPPPQRVAEASAPAPFIYFDIVPNFGFNIGVANLTLEAVRFTMPVQGKITGERVAVAHLRTSVAFGIGPADDDELLPVQALRLDPDPAVARGIG